MVQCHRFQRLAHFHNSTLAGWQKELRIYWIFKSKSGEYQRAERGLKVLKSGIKGQARKTALLKSGQTMDTKQENITPHWRIGLAAVPHIFWAISALQTSRTDG